MSVKTKRPAPTDSVSSSDTAKVARQAGLTEWLCDVCNGIFDSFIELYNHNTDNIHERPEVPLSKKDAITARLNYNAARLKYASDCSNDKAGEKVYVMLQEIIFGEFPSFKWAIVELSPMEYRRICGAGYSNFINLLQELVHLKDNEAYRKIEAEYLKQKDGGKEEEEEEEEEEDEEEDARKTEERDEALRTWLMEHSVYNSTKPHRNVTIAPGPIAKVWLFEDHGDY